MAFPPDLEVEVAFNNDINEADYAQSGWTSILPFVASFDGDLRGREYELDRAEAGTLNVTLDNADGRFIPGSVGSPYYPNVKSDRRFRIRGKNMLHPNVARGGSRDRNTTGLVSPPQEALTILAGGTPTFSVTTKRLDLPYQVTATTQDTTNGYLAVNATDGIFSTKWAATSATGTLTYQLVTGITVRSYSIQAAGDDATKDPKAWTFDGSNDGSTWTNLDTQSGQTFASRYQTNTYVLAFPFYYRYYRLAITSNNGHASNVQLSDMTLYHNLDDNFLADTDVSHYFEVRIPSGNTPVNATHRTIGWYGPLEYGVRLTHSAYIWRLSGTEPTGFKIRLEMAYFDGDWNEITTSIKPFGETNTVPSADTPSRYNFSHTPPPTAKYGIVTVTFVWGSTTNSTDLVYGVCAAQSELTQNLAPDISGYRDLFNWQIEGTGDSTTTSVGTDPTTSYLEVTWDDADTSIGTTIPHLIPGEQYTAAIEAQIVGSQPSVLFTGDESQTGTTISSTSWTTYTTTFTAQQAEQQLQWVLQGTSTNAVGLRLRKLSVRPAADIYAGFPANSAWDTDVSDWKRPKDIFEGWVESWPVQGGSTEMTITVVDRMKRLGEIELENTLAEAMFQDRPDLMLPLYDSMLDTPGRFSQLGKWADEDGGPTYVDIAHQRGDLGVATYTTSTDDGPTGEASLKLAPASIGANGVGYFLAIPYTQDYVAPGTPPPPPKPGPAPTPSTPKPSPKPAPPKKYVYTKTWYANWSRSYESDNSTRFDDPPTMYQGSYTGSNNQKSLAGFDYNNIKAILNGAEILEAYITVKNDHARWNKGLYVFVGTHNYTTKPSTWSGGSVRERRWKKFVTEGDSATINIGVTAGAEFKTGSSRGISIGPEPTNDHDNYGYFRGASQSGKPYLTIKYRK